MTNGLHRHKCRNCKVEQKCPKVTHCKQSYEVEECFDCYANRVQAKADAERADKR